MNENCQTNGVVILGSSGIVWGSPLVAEIRRRFGVGLWGRNIVAAQSIDMTSLLAAERSLPIILLSIKRTRDFWSLDSIYAINKVIRTWSEPNFDLLEGKM